MPSELFIEKIHKVSKGKDVKIGMIDDNCIEENGVRSYKFIKDNNDPTHGKIISTILKRICPDSEIICLITFSDNRENYDLLLLLSIIACILLECDIINISNEVDIDTQLLPVYDWLFKGNVNLVSIPIVNAVGNAAAEIPANNLSIYDKAVTSISGYDPLTNKPWPGARTGAGIDCYMPTSYNNKNATSHSTAYFTSIISNYISILKAKKIPRINIHSTLKNNIIQINNPTQRYFTLNIQKLFKK